MTTEERIFNIISENFLAGTDLVIDENTQFLEDGILDSMAMIQFVELLEAEFDFKIFTTDLLPENFGSISNIATFLSKQEVC